MQRMLLVGLASVNLGSLSWAVPRSRTLWCYSIGAAVLTGCVYSTGYRHMVHLHSIALLRPRFLPEKACNVD